NVEEDSAQLCEDLCVLRASKSKFESSFQVRSSTISVSPDRANAEDSRNLAPTRRLEAHGYLPFVLNQIHRDLVVNIEEVTDRAAVWTSFNRLLTKVTAIDQNLG